MMEFTFKKFKNLIAQSLILLFTGFNTDNFRAGSKNQLSWKVYIDKKVYGVSGL